MIWVVRHKCPSGVRFAFNCYRHWFTLVIREGNGMSHFLYGKEGVNQGDPQVIVAYGLWILPLIQELRTAHPSITQPVYADDTRPEGNFEVIRCHLDDLMVQVPPHGYFPNPNKSVLVMSTRNVMRAEAFFWGYGL